MRHLGPWLDPRILLSTATHLVGVPFTVPRTLLWVPSGRTVEGIYEAMAMVKQEVQPT